MPQGNVFSRMASASVLPYSFVKLDSANPFNVINCSAVGDRPIGISSEAAYQPPIPQLTGTQNAADAGQMLKIFGQGCTDVLLKIGAGGVTAGDFLTSDANGSGVTAVATNRVGARANDTRAAGELCRVEVLEGFAM